MNSGDNKNGALKSRKNGSNSNIKSGRKTSFADDINQSSRPIAPWLKSLFEDVLENFVNMLKRIFPQGLSKLLDDEGILKPKNKPIQSKNPNSNEILFNGEQVGDKLKSTAGHSNHIFADDNDDDDLISSDDEYDNKLQNPWS